MKKNIALILAAALVLPTVIAAGGCGANSGVSSSAEATAENPMVLTLAHGLSETHTVHIAMTQFADEVKEKTDGRIIINIFPNGQLGSETENLEQLQAGVIAMTKVSAPGLATYNEAYNTFGLPYIFNDTEDFYDIMDSEDMQDFFLSSEEDGFVTITYFTSGARSFYTKNTAVNAEIIAVSTSPFLGGIIIIIALSLFILFNAHILCFSSIYIIFTHNSFGFGFFITINKNVDTILQII